MLPQATLMVATLLGGYDLVLQATCAFGGLSRGYQSWRGSVSHPEPGTMEQTGWHCPDAIPTRNSVIHHGHAACAWDGEGPAPDPDLADEAQHHR